MATAEASSFLETSESAIVVVAEATAVTGVAAVLKAGGAAAVSIVFKRLLDYLVE